MVRGSKGRGEGLKGRGEGLKGRGEGLKGRGEGLKGRGEEKDHTKGLNSPYTFLQISSALDNAWDMYTELSAAQSTHTHTYIWVHYSNDIENGTTRVLIGFVLKTFKYYLIQLVYTQTQYHVSCIMFYSGRALSEQAWNESQPQQLSFLSQFSVLSLELLFLVLEFQSLSECCRHQCAPDPKLTLLCSALLDC